MGGSCHGMDENGDQTFQSIKKSQGIIFLYKTRRQNKNIRAEGRGNKKNLKYDLEEDKKNVKENL